MVFPDDICHLTDIFFTSQANEEFCVLAEGTN